MEREYLLQAFDSGWVSSTGVFVNRATSEFPPAVGQEFGVPCANGTVALHLALLALGAGPGDEVIVPNFTYIATANAPLFVGATPVLADVQDRDWSIDPKRVEDLITSRTRGVIAVHLYGHLADLTELRAVCDRHGLWLVEDCAEVLGAPLAESRPGAWGELSTWSFYGNKVLTTGEGGFVTSLSRKDLIQRVYSYRGQAVDPARKFYHRHLGFNFRLTNLQCALLCAQLESLQAYRDVRARIQSDYEETLLPGIEEGLLVEGPRPSICWMFSPLVNEERYPGIRAAVMLRLLDEFGIETRPFFPLMQEMPHLSGVPRGPMMIAPRLSCSGMNLPTYVDLTRKDVEVISECVLKCLRDFTLGRS